MPLEFTKEEVEREIADIIKYGDIREIARIAGIGEKWLSRQLNADDAETSAIFRALQIICAEFDVDETRGEELQQTFNKFIDLSRKRKIICLSAETGKLNKEVAEFVASKLDGLPIGTQFAELLDIETQFKTVKQAYIEEYNREKSKPKEPSLKIAR